MEDRAIYSNLPRLLLHDGLQRSRTPRSAVHVNPQYGLLALGYKRGLHPVTTFLLG